MDIEQNKVINLTDHKRFANHELCRECRYDETCSSVCIAVEILVQLCKTKSPMAQLEYLYNIGTRLDLENSFTAPEL